jgi:hypothetical protein
MPEKNTYTFQAGLEPVLKGIAERGNHAIVRVYVDYPTKDSGMPDFLLNSVPYSGYADYDNVLSVCPDYNNENMVSALEQFIAAFGERYDKDPRIGFVQMGLLGFWGEWHINPSKTCVEANDVTRSRVLNSYMGAFGSKKLQLRQPYANSPSLPTGYHDDSFASYTLCTASDCTWYFWPVLVENGLGNIWQTQAIGGEVQPNCQPYLWDVTPPAQCPPGTLFQDYDECRQTTHASWLLHAFAFRADQGFTGEKRARAIAGATRLGYDLRIKKVLLQDPVGGSDGAVDLEIANNGVAPFYYDWTVELAILDQLGTLSWQGATQWKLTSILPGTPVSLHSSLPIGGLPKGHFKVLLRATNPMFAQYPNAKHLGFSNASQDVDRKGWVTLGVIGVGDSPNPGAGGAGGTGGSNSSMSGTANVTGGGSGIGAGGSNSAGGTAGSWLFNINSEILASGTIEVVNKTYWPRAIGTIPSFPGSFYVASSDFASSDPLIVQWPAGTSASNWLCNDTGLHGLVRAIDPAGQSWNGIAALTDPTDPKKGCDIRLVPANSTWQFTISSAVQVSGTIEVVNKTHWPRAIGTISSFPGSISVASSEFASSDPLIVQWPAGTSASNWLCNDTGLHGLLGATDPLGQSWNGIAVLADPTDPKKGCDIRLVPASSTWQFTISSTVQTSGIIEAITRSRWPTAMATFDKFPTTFLVATTNFDSFDQIVVQWPVGAVANWLCNDTGLHGMVMATDPAGQSWNGVALLDDANDPKKGCAIGLSP